MLHYDILKILYYSAEKMEEIISEARIAYEDDNWMVVVQLTKDVAIYYGKDTYWVVSLDSGKNKTGYFRKYSENGNIYIIMLTKIWTD